MLTAFTLFARSRRGYGLVLAMAVGLIGCWILPMELVANPFDRTRNHIVVDLVPLLATMAWPFMAYSPMPQLERTIPARVMIARRAGWWALMALAIFASGLLAYFIRGVSGWSVVSLSRNTLFGLMIATFSSVILPQVAGWIPLALYVGICWIAGTSDGSGTPRFWAIPCYLADSGVSWLVTSGLAIISLVLYCRFERGTSQ